MIFVCITFFVSAQSRGVRQEIERQETEAKNSFPPQIDFDFDVNSLGFYLQKEYKAQAIGTCGITRPATEKRLFIPKDLVQGYELENLKSTSVVELPVSGPNFLFMALTPSDVTKINNRQYNDAAIRARRVIGLNDTYVLFGQAYPSAIDGFPSVFYQKSCGSYYDGQVTAGMRLPVIEMQTSLQAESQSSSLITSITGRFFSPLSFMIKENSIRSVYTHMLIWEKYSEDYNNPMNAAEKLLDNGNYVDEMQATLINRSTNKEVNTAIRGEIAAGATGGAFGVDGKIKSGFETKSNFALKNFTTLVHKSGDEVVYHIRRLPTAKDINTKLATSLNFPGSPQPQFKGFANHVIKFQISRVMAGVPDRLCDWEIEENSYDKAIWVSKPEVISSPTQIKDYPECSCNISGMIKKTAIDGASGGLISISVILTNKKTAGNEKLKLEITEPSISVTKGPVFASIDDAVANAKFEDAISGGKRVSKFEIKSFIDDTQLPVRVPVTLQEYPEIEFVNATQKGLLTIEPLVFDANAKTFTMRIRSNEVATTWVKTGEINVPIKIKAKVQLQTTNNFTEIVSNTFNLKLPVYEAQDTNQQVVNRVAN